MGARLHRAWTAQICAGSVLPDCSPEQVFVQTDKSEVVHFRTVQGVLPDCPWIHDRAQKMQNFVCKFSKIEIKMLMMLMMQCLCISHDWVVTIGL